MNLLLLVILILILVGGVPAYRSGTIGNPLGIVLLVVVLIVLFGILGPYPAHRWGYW